MSTKDNRVPLTRTDVLYLAQIVRAVQNESLVRCVDDRAATGVRIGTVRQLISRSTNEPITDRDDLRDSLLRVTPHGGVADVHWSVTELLVHLRTGDARFSD